jgi:hypothetical protein
VSANAVCGLIKHAAPQAPGLPPSRELHYNECMARGWESKAIEDQISAAEARQEERAKQKLTASEIEQQKRKQGLLLERARIEREMKEGHKRRYLVLLERALAHVDAELARLERADSAS